MSSTKLFTSFDLRPYKTLSEKQKVNITKYSNLRKTWDSLTPKELELIKSIEEYNSFHGDDYVNVFQFSVKTEFLEKCPHPENERVESLFNDFNIALFVHNETGPAFINMVANREEFYLNGKQVDEEMAKKMMHNSNFVQKLDTLLGE
jgi:hypothetical protein